MNSDVLSLAYTVKISASLKCSTCVSDAHRFILNLPTVSSRACGDKAFCCGLEELVGTALAGILCNGDCYDRHATQDTYSGLEPVGGVHRLIMVASSCIIISSDSLRNESVDHPPSLVLFPFLVISSTVIASTSAGSRLQRLYIAPVISICRYLWLTTTLLSSHSYSSILLRLLISSDGTTIAGPLCLLRCSLEEGVRVTARSIHSSHEVSYCSCSTSPAWESSTCQRLLSDPGGTYSFVVDTSPHHISMGRFTGIISSYPATDHLPPRKRFRDSYSSEASLEEDAEVGLTGIKCRLLNFWL
ncbi:hypothetical protein Tco_1303799 [Tanacetum coccineum]